MSGVTINLFGITPRGEQFRILISFDQFGVVDSWTVPTCDYLRDRRCDRLGDGLALPHGLVRDQSARPSGSVPKAISRRDRVHVQVWGCPNLLESTSWVRPKMNKNELNRVDDNPEKMIKSEWSAARLKCPKSEVYITHFPKKGRQFRRNFGEISEDFGKKCQKMWKKCEKMWKISEKFRKKCEKNVDNFGKNVKSRELLINKI
jgi:hypothetical protein